jgi:hypothetical protein
MGLNKRLINQASASSFGADNFAPVTYTGNRPSTQSITGVGFQPDLVWIKNRDSSSYPHVLTDSVRGNTKYLVLDTSAQYTGSNTITSFDSDGFSLGDNGYFNGGLSGAYNEMVAWCWKAGGAAVSNTDGSITSTVSANQDAGFSIVEYTGTGANATVGHGLSSAPELIIIKRTDNPSSWSVYPPLGSNYIMFLNASDAAYSGSSIWWNNTDPTSSVFTIGTYNVHNASSSTNIAYCFHSVDGYQKVGSYTGTGSVGSPTITTGFQPRFVMIKNINLNQEWVMIDSVRGNNPAKTLYPNYSNAEATSGNNIDFNSDGFTIQESGGGINYRSGDTFLYLAIA